MSVDIVEKGTGKSIQIAGDTVAVDHPSIVTLGVDRSQIVNLERQGNDLVVHLTDGRTVQISGFYAQESGAASDLVLRDSTDRLWVADTQAQGPAQFARLARIDDLLIAGAAEGASAGGGALLPILAGVAGAGGAVAAVASGGGSGGRPASSTGGPDTIAPPAPSVSVGADGTNVSGTGEAGATLQVRNLAGAVIGTGIVGADGRFTIPLTQPQRNGETLTVTQADAAGNISAPTTAVAPDITAPQAPSATMDEAAKTVTGTAEPGATVTVTDVDGVPVSTTTAGPDGGYTVPLTPALSTGDPLLVTQTDPGNNVSPPTVLPMADAAVPAAPTAAVAPDGSAVTGTGEPGATVTVSDTAGTPLGTATALADGSYTVPLPAGLSDGRSLAVTQADPAGNASAVTIVTTPDLVAPGAPTATLAPDGATVTGTGEPGATVTVADATGTALATATVSGEGSYFVTLSPPQANGGTLQIGQSDATGNASPVLILAIPDVTPPAAPVATIAPDGTTITGSAEPGATIAISDASGSPVATAVAAGDGSFTTSISPARSNGETFQVTQTDVAGNVSPAASITAPDTTPPTGLTAAIDGSGAIVSGAGEVGAIVTVRDPAGGVLGTTTVADDGSYTVTLSSPQRNGEALQVTQADAAGNALPPVTTIAPDLTAPAAPVGAVSGDGSAITGTGEPGATLLVSDASGTPIGTATVLANGSYTFPLPLAQTNGETFQLVQRDPTGNVSAAATVVAPDNTAPVGLTAALDGSGSVVTGTGEPGATVTVSDPLGASIGTATVAANGSYSAILSAPQVNGQVLQVTQADPIGNGSTPVTVTAQDLTAPIAPTGAVSGDGATVSGTGEPGALVSVTGPTGTPLGAIRVDADGNYAITLTTPQTNGEVLTIGQADLAGNASPEITRTAPDSTAPVGLTAAVDGSGTIVSGTGEAGATVTVSDPLGTPIGTAIVAGNGAYAVVLTTPQRNGETLQVRQADPIGNPSAPTPVLAPDTTPPAAPVFTVTGTGAAATGTGEPGAIVTVTTATGTFLGSAPVAGDGNFTVPLSPPQANGGIVIATQADGIGNVSPAGTAPAPDTTPPAQPSATLDATGSTVSGTGEPGARIEIRDPSTALIGTGTVNAEGNYAIALTTPQINSQLLSVVQSDAIGNSAPAITLTAPDLTPPAAPAGTVASDGASISGTGEAGATLTITDPAGRVIGTVLVAGDTSFTTALVPPQINGELLVLTQTDVAGNVSPEASAAAPDLVPADSPDAPGATVAPDGLTVSGTGIGGNTIAVFGAGGAALGTATVAPDGSYVVTLTTPQRNGEALRVVQVDAEGDASPATVAIAPDLTAPAVPTAAIDAAGAVVTGTGEAGATVQVAEANGGVLGTGTVNAGGEYTVVLTTPQTNGQALTVTQADAATNPSPGVPLTAPDLTPPAAPGLAISADGVSATGTGEPGATVTIRDATGTSIGTALVAPNGTYVAALATPQLNGQRLTAIQTDLSANSSPAAAATAPDTTLPAAPTATVDSSGTVVSGTGEAGATVTVRDPSGVPIATAVVGANGGYTALLPTAQLGGQVLQVTQTDPAGNLSPATPAAAPDITPPAAPAGTVSVDGAAVAGTGEAGATVTIFDPTGAPIGTALVAPDGSFTATLTAPQTNAQLLTLSQADPAGNISPTASATAPDLTPPAAPTASVNATGTVVTGTGEAGATVIVRDPAGNPVGTAVVAGNGAYAVALTTPQANGQALQVTQSDRAGNLSPVTGAIAPDITAPIAPAVTVNGTGTVVTGIGEAGATVRITDAAGALIGTALVAGDGTFAAALTTPQANGQTLSVIQTDVAGNISPATVAVAPDITAPAAPTGVAINGQGTVVTGTGEPNAIVEVRDPAGTVIGTGTVASNGSFAVTLTDPQIGGETLAVSQRDAANNPSGAVPILAPFDLTAFDNTAGASIDLLPRTTSGTLGSAEYLALVSLGLLNLDVQVLSIPNVPFTVASGHTLDATFTYDAVLSLGVLSGYSVVVQRFDGANWVAVTGPGSGSLLELGLLNGNLSATQTLGPGQYRAFVTFDGALGVGLLGGLTVTGVDSDFTDVVGATPNAASGNVITDPGVGGAIDIANPQTVVQSVTIGGVTTAITADDTIVRGAWGTLVIDPNGTYTYTPDANAAAIGKTDVFTYTLLNTVGGETASAALSLAIGSPDITGAPLAANDVASASATFQNLVTTLPPTVDSSFATAAAGLLTGARTGTVSDSFTVSANSTADVTLYAIRQGGLSLLPSYTVTVTNQAGVVVGTVSQVAVAGLPLGSGVALTLDDLPSGTYNYTVSSTNPLGDGYGTSIYVGQTVTHLDQFTLAGSAGTAGNLLANDTPGGPFVTIMMQSGGGFVEIGEAPLVITGAHGTLTVSEAGDYSYQPSATLAYSATDPIDSFTYQLMQPNGQISTARLDVAVDINNGVAPAVSAAPLLLASASVEAVPLASLMAQAEAEPASTPASEARLALLGTGLVEDQGTMDDLLGQFLSDRQPLSGESETHLAATEATPAPDISAAPIADDPLAYLASPQDLDHDRALALHPV